jgi:2-oxoglutarate dehydrogenase E1 component
MSNLFPPNQADDYPNAEIVWMQEEPKNMGAWSYVRPRIQTALKKSSAHAGKEVGYVDAAQTGSLLWSIGEERG